MSSFRGLERVTFRRGVGGMAALGAGACLVTLTACGGGSAPTAAASSSPGGSCQGSSGDVSATTAKYVVVLDIGSPEEMYSQQQVAAMHPSTGEVMLGGMMTSASGPNVHHVEAHICSRSSGSVVTGESPTITVTDTSAGTPPKDLPVAEMQGVGQGVSDYHYGNNAVLVPGHSYTITVRLNGESAALTYKAS